MAKKHDEDSPGASIKEIDERLRACSTEIELQEVKQILVAEGTPSGSVTSRISKLKKAGKLSLTTSVATASDVPEKQLPVDAIVKEMRMNPSMATDAKSIAVFNSGMQFGVNTVIMGVRLAQELSRMGIAQASPIMKMASEMRRYEGQSAIEAGRAASEDAYARAAGYFESMQPREGKVDIATTTNPMQGMMARVMESMLEKALLGGQQSQPQGGANLPPGWGYK